jgi:phosphoribosylpyrophosphate synthetase
MFVSNTIPQTGGLSRPKVEIVSVASLFATAIDYIIGAKSISSLFR